MGRPRQGYLARWIPAIIVAAFLGDVALHFVRLDFLAFRSVEAVRQFAPQDSFFEPDRAFRIERASGDLSGLGNLPELRTFRPEAITTDHLGYRNAPGHPRLPPEVLLLGTSFTFGGGNSDEDTLSRRLEVHSGRSVYNAGGWDYVAAQARELTRRLGMKNGLVLVEFLERDAWEPPIIPALGRPRIPFSPAVRWYYKQASRSRLKILAEHLYKKLCNDRILPNSYRSTVAVRELAGGRTMLFYRTLEHPSPPATLDGHVRGIERLRDVLREDGHRLGVYLIPDKLTAYRDLIRPPVPGSDVGAGVLAAMDRGLRALGIPTSNLEPVLRAAASEALERGELVYWPDDTHWNPRGIDVAAREMARELHPPAARGRPAAEDRGGGARDGMVSPRGRSPRVAAALTR